MKDTNHQDDLVLPDDLIEVAAQLSDDAEHLVASYPAGKPNLWAAKVVQPARLAKKPRWRRGLAAAAAVLVIAPTTWFASGLTRPNQTTPTANVNQVHSVAATASRSPNAPVSNSAISLVGMPIVDQQDRPVSGRSFKRVVLVPLDMWEHIQVNRVWQEQKIAEYARHLDHLQKENAKLQAAIDKQ